MFEYRPRYMLVSAALLAALVAIALWVRDDFVRPFLGDVLAVIFVYTLLRAMLAVSIPRGIILALMIAFGLEFAQYFRLIDQLGLAHNAAARIILGATFDPLDLLSYTIGCGLVGCVEAWRARRARDQR